MYGKLFAQMYDGTLGTRGPWEALVTFQQMVILADEHGVVDMTAEAISRRTTVPLPIIVKGIAELEQPDEKSRTPDEDGRRILRLSDSRDWGWKITNYAHYRNIRSQAERREYMRQYQRKYREARKQNVNNVNKINQSSKQYAYTRETPRELETAPVDNPKPVFTESKSTPKAAAHNTAKPKQVKAENQAARQAAVPMPEAIKQILK